MSKKIEDKPHDVLDEIFDHIFEAFNIGKEWSFSIKIGARSKKKEEIKKCLFEIRDILNKYS